MRKRVLYATILLCVVFGSLMLSQAVDFQDSTIQSNFEQINQGAPYKWTITSRGYMWTDPLLCDLEGDGEQELIIVDNMDGLILANAGDGSQIWSYFSYNDIRSDVSPRVSDLNGDSILDIVITVQNGFTALDGSDGATLWEVYEDNPIMQGAVIEVDDFTPNSVDDILFKFENNTLALFQGDTGDLLWKTTNRSQHQIAVESSPSSSKNILSVEGESDGTPVLVNGSTGEALWRGDQSTSFERTPIIADLNNDDIDELIIGHLTGNGEEIIAIDVSNGTTLWNSPALQQSWSFNGMIAEDIDQDGDLEVIVSQGYTHALDGTNGSHIWTFYSSSDQSVVGIADLNDSPDKELIIKDRGSIHALDAESGEILWSREISLASEVEIADFDGDTLDEVVTISVNAESYIINGDDGNIIWFGFIGPSIDSIQFVEFSDAPPSVIYASTSFVSLVEINNLDPNTQMILTLIQYAPISIGIAILAILIVLRKMGKLDKSKLFDNDRFSRIWTRILQIDATSRKFKIAFWIIILFAPWLLIYPINTPSIYFLFAPLWFIYSMGVSYGIQVAVMGFGTYGIMLGNIIFVLGLSIPLIIPAIILELRSRQLVVFGMPRKFVVAYMVLIGGVGLLIWASRLWIVIAPIPIASVVLLVADSIVRKSIPQIRKVEPTQK
ncbi:MAG: PQQ-binding-like beta-propeller repeat protein, partial [Candidatus Thorarchaeota archaeon]